MTAFRVVAALGGLTSGPDTSDAAAAAFQFAQGGLLLSFGIQAWLRGCGRGLGCVVVEGGGGGQPLRSSYILLPRSSCLPSSAVHEHHLYLL